MSKERIEELEELTVTQLRKMCKDMGLTGLSRAKEMDCIEAIIKKEQEIESQLKGVENQEDKNETVNPIDSNDESYTEGELPENSTPEQPDDNPEEQENTEFDEAITIQRTSKCGNYRVKIKGVSEAARRSGIAPEEVEEALENGKPVGGWTFKEVE